MSTPEVRFEGFAGEWEEKKLGDFGNATSGTSIESEFSEDGIYKVISIGSYSENSVYTDQGIRAKDSEKTRKRVLNKDDLTMILNDKTSSGNIIGRVLIIEESGVYVYNQRTERIEIDAEKYDSLYIYQMLNAPLIREKIIKQSQGKTQIYVNWSQISLTEYKVPGITEQRKLGMFFKNIDRLIELYQCKYEEIKILKKYMLQKMFPQNGVTVPEIRFDGFTDVWEQHKCKEIADFAKGNGYSKSDLREKGTPVILYGRLYTKYEFSIADVDTFADKKRGAIFSEGNEVIIPASGETAEDIARASAVIKSGIILGGDLNIVSPFDYIKPEFLALTISNGEPQKELAKRAQGKSVVHVHNSDIKEVMIAFPKVQEQKKIIAYFKSIDVIIALYQRKLEKLKKIKKFCLEKMFI